MIQVALSILAVTGGIATAQPTVDHLPALAMADVAAVVQQEVAAGAAQEAQPAAQLSASLPQREPPPRTLSAFWPVYVGFVVALFAIVGYILRGVGARSARIAEAIDRLEAAGAD